MPAEIAQPTPLGSGHVDGRVSVLEDRIADRSAKVAVVGQGYVGLVVAMAAREAGFEVVGYEVDGARVARLRSGRSYIEDVTDDRLEAALSAGYRPSDDPADLSGFDIAVISVPTPLDDGVPDLSYIEAAGEELAPHVRPDTCVVLESTTYPGTTAELLAPILEAGSGLRAGEDFALGYSPERIDPGNATWGLENTPKVVSGIDPRSLDLVDAFFSTFVRETVRTESTGAAELSKVLENTFRHVNIALVNELAMFARALDADVFEAVRAASTKPFGFMAFTPGPGVGGHCLPIDPTFLSWRVKQDVGETFRFVELANDVNQHMPRYVTRRAQAVLNDHSLPVRGSEIVVVGLSYKRNVGDWRESPSIPLLHQLATLGARLTAVDPHVEGFPLPDGVDLVAALTDELVDAADLVVVVVDHDELDWQVLARTSTPVLDTRDHLRGYGADNVVPL